MKNGGYVMVSANDTNIYEKLNKALTLGKPVLFYEDANTCYYIDTMSKDGDGNIILTKGGKTITIEADGDITETGNIQNHLYLITINCSDDYLQFLSTEKIDNYTIEDSNNLTDDDKNFLKSLKGKLQLTSSFGYNGVSSITKVSYGLYYKDNDILYLAINDNDIQFNLSNPTNGGDSDTLNFECIKLF